MGDFTSKMSLATWDAISDPYSYEQLSNNWLIVDQHDHSPGRGVQIAGPGIANYSIGLQHVGNTLAQDLGLNNGSSVGRGAIYNAGPGTTSSASAGALNDAADSISNLVVNTNGLIMCYFTALWQCSVASDGFAILTLNGTQVQDELGAAAPATCTSTTNITLCTDGASGVPLSSVGAGTQVSTGQIVSSGAAPIFVNAGTYTLAVEYYTSGGATLTVTNRRLWAWTVNF